MADAESSQAGKGPPVIGSYRLIQSLGSGGMSSVYHAVHIESGHEVALKILPRTLAKNPTLLQRFIREAKNAESLEHPNIAAIFDRGFDEGRHYLVLEYVEGGDLHERVKGGGPLAVDEAVRVIRGVAEGLSYALSRGVIHRDVKPANLLMTPAGRIKIIDLGLALQTEAEDERVTRDGTTVGTVDYMSPEQARDSRATSERSDIYSLGCTFYYLLTGSAPFPGGDVPDKLGRHCTAPVPDARAFRPEVSEPLARLVQKMMAKRPEGRHDSYEQLIVAIDSLPESSGIAPVAMLDALIAEDDEDDISLVPFGSEVRPDSGDRSSHRRTDVPAEVSLADLASIEDEPADTRPLPRPTPIHQGPALADLYGAKPRPAPRTASGELPLSTWVAAGAVLGLSIALIGYGVLRVLQSSGGSGPAVVDRPDGEQGGSTPRKIQEVQSPPRNLPPRPPAATGPKSIVREGTEGNPAWSEPAEPTVVRTDEASYPPEVETEALPEWARLPIADVEGPAVTLRRVRDHADPTETSSLRQALDKGGTLVEIADDGPFFEDDCRVPGKGRVIRARAGYRPMIRISAPKVPVIRDRPGVFTLDGSKLTIEGIDLIVDTRDLPSPQSALFVLRNAELTLHRCTITVVNHAQRPFSLVRVDEPPDQRPDRTSRVRLEQTLVRWSAPTVVDVHGPADIVLVRSLVLGGFDATILQRPAAPSTRGDRRYFLDRSVVATRGHLLDVPGGASVPPQVRATGSTFAKIEGVNGLGLIRSRAEPLGPPESILGWRGFDNAFVGWASWLGGGERETTVLAGLAEATEAWKGTDASSREVKRGWSLADPDLATPATLMDLPEARPEILARIASPSPNLLGVTVGVLARPPIPELPRRPPAVVGGLMTPPVPTTAAPSAGDTNATLDFATGDLPWRGDLGLFLASKMPPGATRVRVRVEGAGAFAMTPVKLVGVSLEIEAGSGQATSWSPVAGASASALFEIVGGDLKLTGVTLASSANAKVPRLIAVEDGHLALLKCVLKSGEGGLAAGSGLILFRAPITRRLPARVGPFTSPTDRPTCLIAESLLIAVGGEALGAEMGRGLVSLVNTLVVSVGDGAAIGLRPCRVARARFEADLSLDRCSIAAEKSVVRSGAWPGADPGPDRPWLVSTNRTAFFEIAPAGKRSAVLLRSIGDGLGHGGLFWQARGDTYDLAHFAASGEATPNSGALRPDVKTQWVDFWDARHIEDVSGPNPKTDSARPLLTRDRPRPGGLTVESFRLDAKAHPDLGADFRLLPAGPPVAAIRF